MNQWLYAIDDVPREMWEGWEKRTSLQFWTAARRDPATDAVILRHDRRGSGQPRWRVGDRVVAYDIVAGRCFAVLRVSSPADWDREEGSWRFSLDLLALNWDGPEPADVGITVTQGARARLGRHTYDRAYVAITKAAV